jgi:hypothetical protein
MSARHYEAMNSEEDHNDGVEISSPRGKPNRVAKNAFAEMTTPFESVVTMAAIPATIAPL